MNPVYTPQPKRKYKLTPAGRRSLQTSIQNHKPWQKSTGPRTFDGKLVVRQNGYKHGLFSRDFRNQSADFAASLRRFRTGAVERTKAGPPVDSP